MAAVQLMLDYNGNVLTNGLQQLKHGLLITYIWVNRCMNKARNTWANTVIAWKHLLLWSMEECKKDWSSMSGWTKAWIDFFGSIMTNRPLYSFLASSNCMKLNISISSGCYFQLHQGPDSFPFHIPSVRRDDAYLFFHLPDCAKVMHAGLH